MKEAKPSPDRLMMIELLTFDNLFPSLWRLKPVVKWPRLPPFPAKMTLIHPVLKKSRFRSRHRLIGCLHGGRKILEGVTSFRLVYNVPAEISVRVVPNYRWIQKELKSLKMAGGKKKKKKYSSWALLLSLLELITTFQQNYDNNQLVVIPDEMETKRPILPWLATERPAPSFVWFVPSTRIFQASAVYMVLESSSCQDLPIS